MTRPSLVGLFALLAGPAALAAGPVDVSPLVNDRTFAVARLDLTRVNVRAAFDWGVDTARRAGVPDDALKTAQQAGGVAALAVQPAVDALKRAGVTELTAVVQMADTLDAPPVVMLAVARPADPKPVVAALAPLNFRNGEKDGLMVFSPNLPPGRLATLRPVARPELDTRLDAAAYVASFGFADPLKAEIADRAKIMDAEFAGLLKETKRCTIRLDLDHGPHVVADVETMSPDAAAALKATIEKQRPGRADAERVRIVKALPLNVDGPHLRLDARQPDFDALFKAALPGVAEARKSATIVQSQSNMRSLMQGAMVYAADNRGRTPSSLADLGKPLGQANGVVPAGLLTNPARPDLGPNGYVYVRAADNLGKLGKAAVTVAIYEAGDFGEGVNVAFWDGHVEHLTDAAKFKQLLADAQPPAAPAP